MKIPCYMEFDKRTSTITIRHAKYNTIQLMVKLEANSVGTMARIVPTEDCDNWWIGVKPADSVVLNDGLFSQKSLIVKSIDFDLK